MIDWIIENLITELIFGVLFVGGVAFMWRYLRDAWKAVRIFRIISTHNNETRTRRKGFHARDRFMDIYEAKQPLVSRSAPYNTGFISSAFNEDYVDKGILEAHGLVTIKDTSRGVTVEVNKSRVTNWVYALAKRVEDREKKRTEEFVLDKSGKLRRLPQK